MLYDDRNNDSEGTDVYKTNGSRKCIIYSFDYFLKVLFRFYLKVCDGCHNLTQNAMSFNNAIIVSVKGTDYKTHFWYMDKDEAINIMKTYAL